MKNRYMALAFIGILAYNHPFEEGTTKTPTAQSDVRMGADAAKTGTNVSDQKMQAQEERGKVNLEENLPDQQQTKEIEETEKIKTN